MMYCSQEQNFWSLALVSLMACCTAGAQPALGMNWCQQCAQPCSTTYCQQCGEGAVAHADSSSSPAKVWVCSACTYHNASEAATCEICGSQGPATCTAEKVQKKDQIEDECPLCLEPYKEGGEKKVTLSLKGKNKKDCGHTFHVSCLQACLAEDSRCPMCRTWLSVGELEKLGVLPPPLSLVKRSGNDNSQVARQSSQP